jgi:hypothetical protein
MSTSTLEPPVMPVADEDVEPVTVTLTGHFARVVREQLVRGQHGTLDVAVMALIDKADQAPDFDPLAAMEPAEREKWLAETRAALSNAERGESLPWDSGITDRLRRKHLKRETEVDQQEQR